VCFAEGPSLLLLRSQQPLAPSANERIADLTQLHDAIPHLASKTMLFQYATHFTHTCNSRQPSNSFSLKMILEICADD
jgi:hypothetical protein